MSMAQPPRTVVFLSYWGTDEPLTLATVVPTLHMLIGSGLVDRVVLCTIERAGRPVPPPLAIPGCVHVQWGATDMAPRPLARAFDLLRLRDRIVRVVREHRPVLIMARGVVAGGFAHFAARSTGVPYAVDYFEPHADYMADVGEWRRGGPLYRGLSWLIRLQCRSALRMVAVAHNYRRMLVADGVAPERVLVAPCPVDLGRMRFDPAARAVKRREVGLGDGLVGIYLGKFGGLYHRERSHKTFARFLELAGPSSRMVVLTPEPRDRVLAGLQRAGVDLSRVHVGYAPHDDVPAWLSASDVAFAPYRGTPSSACISPMKVGEYWAAGLPVLLTRGVGDDSAIIADDPDAGALYDPEGDDLDAALRAMLARIGPKQRERTGALAARHRSMRLTEEAYRAIMAALADAQRNQASSA